VALREAWAFHARLAASLRTQAEEMKRARDDPDSPRCIREGRAQTAVLMNLGAMIRPAGTSGSLPRRNPANPLAKYVSKWADL
jgi:hypothetical protein